MRGLLEGLAELRAASRARLRAGLARRIPVLLTGGHEALLGPLHPRLRWRDEGLERTGIAFEANLDGRGLLLRPPPCGSARPQPPSTPRSCATHH